MVKNQNYSTSFSILHISSILIHPVVLCYITSNTNEVQVKVKFRLEQAMKIRTGSKGITLPFLYLRARWCGWSTPRPGRFTLGKDLVSIVQEAG
jgi:hypothetical protein